MMENTYSFIRKVVLVVIVALATAPGLAAQRLQVNELMTLQSKSLQEIRSTLESKGWLYSGNCGGDNMPRQCFKIGDGGKSLAAVLYVEGSAPGDQAIEYTVFRKGLINQVQSSLRATAMKLLRQEPISNDVKLRVYEKGGHVVVARGGVEKQYYSVKVQRKPAYNRMQASR